MAFFLSPLRSASSALLALVGALALFPLGGCQPHPFGRNCSQDAPSDSRDACPNGYRCLSFDGQERCLPDNIDESLLVGATPGPDPDGSTSPGALLLGGSGVVDTQNHRFRVKVGGLPLTPAAVETENHRFQVIVEPPR